MKCRVAIKTKVLVTLMLLCCQLACADVKPVKLKLSGWGGVDQVVMRKIIYELLAPELAELNVQIEYFAAQGNYNAYLLNAFSSTNTPDIFYIDVADAEALTYVDNLGVFGQQEKNNLVELINPRLTKLFTFDGELFGIPKDFNTLSIQFNKDMFDQANVEYLSNNETFESFKEKLSKVVHKLNQQGFPVVGMCMTPEFSRFAPFAFSAGWQPFDNNKKTLLDEHFIKAFNYYVGFVREGLAVLPGQLGHMWSSGCLSSELAVASIEGAWISQHIRLNSPHLNYGTVAPPTAISADKKGNIIFSVAWGVSKTTENPMLARKVIQLFTSKKIQKFLLENAVALPSMDILDIAYLKNTNEQELINTSYHIMKNSKLFPYNFHKYGKSWVDPIDNALRAAIYENTDVKTAIEHAQTQYNVMYKKVYGE